MILNRLAAALLRGHSGALHQLELDPRPWLAGGVVIGSKRPDGWELDALILRRGIRAGGPLRVRAAENGQILVETQ